MRRPVAFTVLPLLLAGCGGGGDGSATGTIDLSITDAPIDSATAVVVQFTGVEIKPAGGETRVVTFESPKTIDLLDFQDGASAALLEDFTLEAGRYSWIRLQVAAERGVIDSYIDLEGGGRESLYIPSGGESGLKLVRGFSVFEGGNVDFTIDFDLRKSVHQPSGGSDYYLRPALRLVQTDRAAAIVGTVDPNVDVAGTTPGATIPGGGTCAAYAFTGSGITPDDEGSAAPPVATGLLHLDDATGNYRYRVAFLEPGIYTVALTCQAESDQPETDDAIAFSAAQEVTLTSGEQGSLDFSP